LQISLARPVSPRFLQLQAIADDIFEVMMEYSPTRSANDDPRKLNQLLSRATELAQVHSVNSVVVGLAAPEGDCLFPEFLDFLKSALRVEDGIFRMTRERAVLHLADVELACGQMVLDRLLENFTEEFPALEPPAFETRFYDVRPDSPPLKVKDVLVEIFARRVLH
jgi:hypothetical protein